MARAARKRQTPGRRATIRDVAAAAGVSAGTVSKVLGQTTDAFADKTVERIRRVAAELNYVPNRLVRSLQTRRSRMLALRLSSWFRMVGRPYSIFMFDRICEAARTAGYDLQLHLNKELEAEAFLDGSVDGAIIQGLSGRNAWEALARVGFPCVVMDVGDICDGVGQVAADGAGGIADAVKYLWGLGHRRIGYEASEPDVSAPGRERLDSFLRTAAELTCEVRHGDVFTGTYEPHEGAKAARQWSAMGDEHPTAVVCDHYLGAVEASEELQRLGLSVPRDVSVIGVDDLAAIRPTSPDVTIVTPPLEQMARDAVTSVVRLIEGGKAANCRTVYPMELRVKGSTAPPVAVRGVLR